MSSLVPYNSIRFTARSAAGQGLCSQCAREGDESPAMYMTRKGRPEALCLAHARRREGPNVPDLSRGTFITSGEGSWARERPLTAHDQLTRALEEAGFREIARHKGRGVTVRRWAGPDGLVLLVDEYLAGGFEIYEPRPSDETVPQTIEWIRSLAGLERTPHNTRPASTNAGPGATNEEVTP